MLKTLHTNSWALIGDKLMVDHLTHPFDKIMVFIEPQLPYMYLPADMFKLFTNSIMTRFNGLVGRPADMKCEKGRECYIPKKCSAVK